ncbi:SigB/SigF/SigG family RNA polymerase sigma factor [Actinoplanes oblitus]|uniref:SigB/SigF/SigG family RNA polymerase sigma factor n=1 Tax=Actinoplanes oblitus TaxID=3040509 RepID=A0ABY8WNY8_9ACTN|nr:SigB/SigF/SigG family RNA polymerase sigma factor [Actinoplanes oblitus]WIM99353.1 SigB/SigF/SigG family RNA polymerase sigma factor [Actinoplanes oblitus]
MRSSAVPFADLDDPSLEELAATSRSDPAWPVLRERVINAWLPMARRLARRYANRGEDSDDLVQVATVGLIKAVDGFEPERGGDFASYAIPTVLGELKRHFRDRMWNIRVPRRLQELNMAINRARGELVQRLGRVPTVADIATHLGIGEEEVIEGLEGAYAYRPASLSTPIGPDGDAELGDSIGGVDPGFELTELHITLGPALARLTEREQQIIALRFHGNLTQSQIGEKIGVSQMHVSRLLTGALGKLREFMN